MWQILAIVLLVVRFIESLFQLASQSNIKGILAKAWQLTKNFALDLETYKK
jgi:hypothetical protein